MKTYEAQPLHKYTYIEICFEAFQTSFLNENKTKNKKRTQMVYKKYTHLFISLNPRLFLFLFDYSIYRPPQNKIKRNTQIGFMFPKSRDLYRGQTIETVWTMFLFLLPLLFLLLNRVYFTIFFALFDFV